MLATYLPYVDIDSFGSNNDSGMFRNSSMGKAFFNDEMSLPVAECLDDWKGALLFSG